MPDTSRSMRALSATVGHRSPSLSLLLALLLSLSVCLMFGAVVVAPALGDTNGGATAVAEAAPTSLDKPVPQDIADLQAIQLQVQRVSQKVLPATVAVQIGPAWGSGVVISKDGYVLTAGHVSGRPGREAKIIFPDGKQVKGVTLGCNNRVDSGLVKITDEGDWPHVEMGNSAQVQPGDWCIATGHPGGFRADRPGVVRLGRVILANSFVMQTDCTLVGGDSGGPLFDMAGRVIGVHSRIGGPFVANFHVPVDVYLTTWDRLKAGDVWGVPQGGGPFLGVEGEDAPGGCRITRLVPDAPAARAGLQVGDVVTRFNDEVFDGYTNFAELVGRTMPGDRVTLEVRRGDAPLTLNAQIGERPER